MNSSASIKNPYKFNWRILLFIPIVAILSHSGSLFAPFVYDDQLTILDNSHLRELDRFQEKIGVQNVVNRSITLLTYAINLSLGGVNTFGYHLLNLIFHILTCICLYFSAKELLTLEHDGQGGRWKELPQYAAILYASHPLTTQPVSYISNRSSLMATFFSLMTFYFFLRFFNLPINAEKAKKAFLIFFMAVMFFLACASKAIAAALPLAMVAFLFFLFSQAPRKILRNSLWVVFPLIFYLGYRTFTLGSAFNLPMDSGSHKLNSLNYLLTQFNAVTFNYGMKVLLPTSLNFEPGIKLVQGFLDPGWIVPALILIILFFLVWQHPSRVARFGIIWAMLTLLPASSIIPLKQLASEHRTYLPFIGISWLIGGCFAGNLWLKRNTVILFSLYMTGLILLSANRTLDYRTEVVLWKDTALKSPRNPLWLNNLANVLIEDNRLVEAEKNLKKAIILDPGYLPPYINLGNIFFKQGRLEEALKKYNAVIKFGYPNKTAYYNSGVVLSDLGRTRQALIRFKKAIQIDPDFAPFHFSLGNAYKKMGMLDEALTEYKITLKYEPDNTGALNNRGTIFMKINKLDLAEIEFRKTLKIRKDHPEALNNLAAIFLKKGLYSKAIRFLKMYLAVKPEDHNTRRVLEAAIFNLNQKQ